MSEYWKSTPTYWCKFCSQYVKDTTLEKKNHEASAKHQNNIQRSLRELHKGKEREERDKQRAKDEVARLNGMFDPKAKVHPERSNLLNSKSQPAPAPPKSNLTTAQQRKAHAEQLAALGVELPEELKKEVTGVGNYQVVNEREVEEAGSVSVNRSLAEILAEAKQAEEQDEVKKEESEDEKKPKKRRLEEDEDLRDEEAAPKLRKAWGSNFKTYPGKKEEAEDVGDLDALLNGVKKKEVQPKVENGEVVKEEDGEASKSLHAVPDIEADASAVPAVVFKKRKGKK